MIKLLHVGYGNYVIPERMIGIFTPDGKTALAQRKQAAKDKRLYDVQAGRKRRAQIVLDTGQVFTSGINAETLGGRTCL